MQSNPAPVAVLEVQARLQGTMKSLEQMVAQAMTTPPHPALYAAPAKDWRLPGDPVKPGRPRRGLPIGKAIKDARSHMGMSQSQLEKATGISHRCLSRVENGHNEPSLSNLGRISDGLGIPLWKLIRHAERMADR